MHKITDFSQTVNFIFTNFCGIMHDIITRRYSFKEKKLGLFI